MKSLYAKLSVTFMLLLLLMGVLFIALGYSIMRDYYEEVTQELNKNIAMYVTDNYHFMEKQGNTDETLQLLADRAMTINPSLEVYLLDSQGKVINHMQEDDSAIRQPAIDMTPIRQFLAGETRFPLRGSDPRSPDSQKIFSVSEIHNTDGMAGYLYVILGGKIHDNIANSLRSSYVLQTGLWYTLLILVSAIGLSLWAFKTLTFRLNNLVDAVKGFRINARESIPISLSRHTESDEISVLNNTLCVMADTINEQAENLKQTDELRRELISNVSHDLRTPLATTQGYIETLMIKGESLDEADRQRYLKIAQRSTQHLSKLVGDLFELTKLEAGQVELNFEPFSLMELMYDTVQEFELLAREKDITLYMPSPNQSVRVFADIELIQRVLGNLVSNAIKFTPKGGSISLGFKLYPDAIQVMVKDTGKGIATDDLQHVFERHYIAKHPVTTTNVPSTGLGLAIVKKILELHNSTISVTSSLNQGSRFQFSLPLHGA